MNQDIVKKNLLKLHNCEEEFTVIFSGKKSNKVNGLYKTGKREIIIHNRNFANDEAGNNLLFYTAIHELAHHIQFTEHKKKSCRTHTSLFYAIMNDLADIAEKKGLYKVVMDAATEKLVKEAHELSCQIAAIQKKLGKVLFKLEEKCVETGIRYEDVIDRKAQISLNTAKKARKAFVIDIPENLSADIQEAVLRENDEDVQQEMINAGQKGKSVEQVKRVKTNSVVNEDETESLLKEKKRLTRTIDTLQRRLDEVVEHLESKGEL